MRQDDPADFGSRLGRIPIPAGLPEPVLRETKLLVGALEALAGGDLGPRTKDEVANLEERLLQLHAGRRAFCRVVRNWVADRFGGTLSYDPAARAGDPEEQGEPTATGAETLQVTDGATGEVLLFTALGLLDSQPPFQRAVLL